jgi:NYN domain
MTDRVMLLIDADNVSLDVIEQAVPWVHQHFGGPHVRRAYCTAESAVKHQAAFKRLSIRPMVNLAAGKNSTDIALAVDAIDLATSERPDVIVIASSDSDFAPLVSRLREKGCRVIGVGQEGKTGDETIGIYDDYEVLSHRKGTRSAAAAAPTKVPTKKRAPRKAPAKKAVPSIPEKAQAIFDALPALAAGDSVELRVAAERLRDAKLLSKSGSSTKLFGQFPELFELRPEKQPNHVQRRAAR